VKPFLLLTGLLTAAALRATDTTYLFTYFTGNGEDGLHQAWSEDGYRWQTLNDDRSILAPQVGKDRLMRDPCVTRGRHLPSRMDHRLVGPVHRSRVDPGFSLLVEADGVAGDGE
jgi:hypothetical protein